MRFVLLLLIAAACSLNDRTANAQTAGLVTASAQDGQVWTLQAHGRVTTESAIVRLGDVARPVGVPDAIWQQWSRMIVALVPSDGRRLQLHRQRIADALEPYVGESTRLLWTGPALISVEYQPAATNVNETANSSHSASVRQAIHVPDSPSHSPAAAASIVFASDARATNTQPAPSTGVTPEPTMVVVAVRPLRRGDILSASDLRYEPLDANRSVDGLLQSINAVVGLEVKNSLYKDRPIRSDDIGPPTLIARGDLVELSVLGGGIIIRTEARAMQAGGEGDLIQIEIAKPRKRLLARVAAPGAVEIVTRPPQTRAR